MFKFSQKIFIVIIIILFLTNSLLALPWISNTSTGIEYYNLQEAIDNASANQKLLLGNGTFTGPIEVYVDNLIITSLGWENSSNNTLSVIDGCGSNDAVYYSQKSGDINKGTFQGITVSNGSQNGIRLTGWHQRINILDNVIKNCGDGIGVSYAGMYLFKINNNHIYNCSGDGIYYNENAAGRKNVIIGNYIHNNDVGIKGNNTLNELIIASNIIISNNQNLYLPKTIDIVINSNYIGRTIGSGPSIELGDTAESLLFYNNTLDNPNGLGIRSLSSATLHLEWVFTNNTFKNCTYAIQQLKTLSNAFFSNNIFISNKSAFNINSAYGYNIHFMNNSFLYNSGDVISSNFASGLVISNNIFYSNGGRILYSKGTLTPTYNTPNQFIYNSIISNGQINQPAIDIGNYSSNWTIKYNNFNNNYQGIRTTCEDTKIIFNNIQNTFSSSLINSQANLITATNNWWGTSLSNIFGPKTSGTVKTSPYRLGPLSITAGYDTSSIKKITIYSNMNLGLNRVRVFWQPINTSDFAEYRIYLFNNNDHSLLTVSNIRAVITNSNTRSANLLLTEYANQTVYSWVTAADNTSIFTNESFYSDSASIVVNPNDVTAPILDQRLSNVAPNGHVKGNFTFYGLMHEEEDPQGVAWAAYGTNNVLISDVDNFDTTQGSNRLWSFTFNTGLLNDGTNTIMIISSNVGGYTSTNRYWITVDNHTPSLRSNFINQQPVNGVLSNFYIEVDDSASFFTNYSFYGVISVSNNYHESNQFFINPSNGYYDLVIPFLNTNIFNIAIWIVDFAGNISAKTFISVTNIDTDNTPPIPSATLMTLSPEIWYKSNITLMGSITENESTLSTYKIFTNNGFWSNINLISSGTSIIWSNDINTSSGALSNGINRIVLILSNSTAGANKGTNITYYIKIDNEIPVFTASLPGMITNGILNKLDITPTENISGVSNIYLTLSNHAILTNPNLNFSTYQAFNYTGSTLTNIGISGLTVSNTNIVIWISDQAGNRSSFKFFSITNNDDDITAPIGSAMLISPTNATGTNTNWVGGCTHFNLLASVIENESYVDATITINDVYYDKGHILGEKSPYLISNNIDINHNLIVSGMNKLTIFYSNTGLIREGTNINYYIFIDSDPPYKPSAVFQDNNSENLTNLKITWVKNNTDNGDKHSGFKEYIVTNYTTSFGLHTTNTNFNFAQNIQYGKTYNVGVAAVDNAGNISPFMTLILQTKQDTTGPVISVYYNNKLISQLTEKYANANFDYNFTITENAAPIAGNPTMIINGVTNNSAVFTGTSNSKSYSINPVSLGNGRHTVEIYASNSSGSNTYSSNAIYVDMQDPVIWLSGPDTNLEFTNLIFVTLSVTDTYTTATGYWQTNNSDFYSFSKSVTIQLRTGTNYLSFYAADTALNISETNLYIYKIVIPSINIPDGSSSNLINYLTSIKSQDIEKELNKYFSRSDAVQILNSIAETTKNNKKTATPVVNLKDEQVLIFLRPDSTNPMKRAESIKIYNRKGQLVRVLDSKDIGEDIIVLWNKNDENKKKVKNGFYIIHIKYKDGISHHIPHVIFED